MIEVNFIKLITPHIAGTPMKEGVLWTNKSCRELSRDMGKLGTPVNRNVIKRLLKRHKVGQRNLAKKKTMGAHPNRNAQFENISALKANFIALGLPVISIDGKKKELIGEFDRSGTVFSNAEQIVNDHSFSSYADGKLTPHGIYDLARNEGYLNLSLSHDTSEFCCDSIEFWWENYGKIYYPNADEILILCDGGGSNSARSYLFKEFLQALADKVGKKIRMAHYPSYCSKYNPIEHRMFPHVTRACKGVVLKSVEVAKEFMEKTSTETGLKVAVNICSTIYKTGKKCAESFVKNMPIVFDELMPNWNYSAIPRFEHANLEVIS